MPTLNTEPYGDGMTKQPDAADKTKPRKATPRKAAPRKTAPRRQAIAPKEPEGFEVSVSEFLGKATQWLHGRPGRVLMMPRDLPAVVQLGVPCGGCNMLIRWNGQAGHTVTWVQAKAGHWASGITAACPGRAK